MDQIEVFPAEVTALTPRRKLVHPAATVTPMTPRRAPGSSGEVAADPILAAVLRLRVFCRVWGHTGQGSSGLEDHGRLLDDLACGGALVLEAFHHSFLGFLHPAIEEGWIIYSIRRGCGSCLLKLDL